MNEGIEVKDPTFAMEFNTNTTPRPNNNTSYNSYNQSYNRGKGKGTNITKVEVEDHTLNLNFPISFQINTIIFQIGPLDQVLKRPTCQICEKLGYLALDCYHRMDYEYQRKHPPTKLSAMAAASNASITQDQPSLADSVATDHVTFSLNHLSFPKPYNDQEHLTVGNA